MVSRTDLLLFSHWCIKTRATSRSACGIDTEDPISRSRLMIQLAQVAKEVSTMAREGPQPRRRPSLGCMEPRVASTLNLLTAYRALKLRPRATDICGAQATGLLVA